MIRLSFVLLMIMPFYIYATVFRKFETTALLTVTTNQFYLQQ